MSGVRVVGGPYDGRIIDVDGTHITVPVAGKDGPAVYYRIAKVGGEIVWQFFESTGGGA